MKKQTFKNTHAEEIATNKKAYSIRRIARDMYGNPRAVIHFSELDITREEYEQGGKIGGLSKYRGKGLGEGLYVFQSWDIRTTIEAAQNLIDAKKR